MERTLLTPAVSSSYPRLIIQFINIIETMGYCTVHIDQKLYNRQNTDWEDNVPSGPCPKMASDRKSVTIGLFEPLVIYNLNTDWLAPLHAHPSRLGLFKKFLISANSGDTCTQE